MLLGLEESQWSAYPVGTHLLCVSQHAPHARPGKMLLVVVARVPGKERVLVHTDRGSTPQTWRLTVRVAFPGSVCCMSWMRIGVL